MSRHCEYLRRETVGEPYTGNPSVRFDEGHGFNPRAYSTGLLFSSFDKV